MESYEELTGYSDEQLVEIFDRNRQQVSVGKQWYIDELSRRRTDRATDAMIALTRQLTFLTWAIAVLTAIGATASVFAAITAG